MLKIRVITVILVLVMALGILSGCGSAKLVDGVYKVEYEDFDSHGYKAQLELTISDSEITDVKFDEVNKDGKFKSQDVEYKTKMEGSSGTYPEKAYAELEKRLIDKQSAKVDAITGATSSSESFIELVKYALDEMASDGKTTSATVPVSE